MKGLLQGMPGERQLRKRLATRQRISDAATRLFFERSFDEVTIEQIAEAADVSRMTVFNHFARKEDMFFDLDKEGRRDLLSAVRAREGGVTPVEAACRFVRRAVAEHRTYAALLDPRSVRFMATIEASEALKARARAIRDELTDDLSSALAEAAGLPAEDAEAQLAASMLLASWTVAMLQAHRVHAQGGDAGAAQQVFSALIVQGSRGVAAALQGTSYV